eukprot:3031076-Amphidinium_carterae.2
MIKLLEGTFSSSCQRTILQAKPHWGDIEYCARAVLGQVGSLSCSLWAEYEALRAFTVPHVLGWGFTATSLLLSALVLRLETKQERCEETAMLHKRIRILYIRFLCKKHRAPSKKRPKQARRAKLPRSSRLLVAPAARLTPLCDCVHHCVP